MMGVSTVLGETPCLEIAALTRRAVVAEQRAAALENEINKSKEEK